MSKQTFYCKECKKEFTIEEKDEYHNYKCPYCGIICTPPGYVGLRFHGLPNTRR